MRAWAAAALCLWTASCTLEEVELRAHPPTGDPGPRDAGVDAADTGPVPDAAADGGEGCTFAVSAPSEVTLGARVHVTSELACVEDPSVHTCVWRAQWSDDADDVAPVEPAPRPCSPGESFDFTAAASSNDGSSVYWVTLAIDGVITPTRGRASVWVSELRQVVLPEGVALGRVFDIAVDPAAHRAWIGAEAGLFAIDSFPDETSAVLPPPAASCNDAAAACPAHTVAVAEGFAFAGRNADAELMARAEIVAGAIVAEDVELPDTTRIRSIVASRAEGDDEDPALYVTSPSTTWLVSRDDLDAPDLVLGVELATGGADLTEIVSTAAQTAGANEALWRLETSADGELQRIATIGNALASLGPEDVLDKNGASLAVWQGLLVVGQRDGRARAVDLAAVDPEAGAPIDDATALFELPDPTGASIPLDRVLDLHPSEDGETLWAVSTDTLYRVNGGVVFRSRAADVPEGLLSVAALEDDEGDEIVLVGTATGIWITRADMPPR